MKNYTIKFDRYEKLFSSARNTVIDLFNADSPESASFMCLLKHGGIIDIIAVEECA